MQALYVALGAVVGATIGTAAAYGAFKARNDPHLVFNPREEPFPYLRRDRENAKFFPVNQKVRDDLDEHYDLLDILNGKYGDH